MRKKHRRKNNQRNIIIFSLIGLVCIFSVGYAAFSSEFLISGKGTIIEKTITIDELKETVVASGDGLYVDIYEEGRYVYRGTNPDNYITFNNEKAGWRIVAVENDNVIKIVKDQVLQNNSGDMLMSFDETGNRTATNNTYCIFSTTCGVFAAVSGTFITSTGKYSGTVTEDSTIKEYLNNVYYESLIDKAKAQLQEYPFNIGAVGYLYETQNDTIEKNIQGEKMYTWTGNVGLANVSDILRASVNPNCTSATDSQMYNNICGNNYFFNINQPDYWLINAFEFDQENFATNSWRVFQSKEALRNLQSNAIVAVKPALFLKSNIILSGSGTELDPYEIVE